MNSFIAMVSDIINRIYPDFLKKYDDVSGQNNFITAQKDEVIKLTDENKVINGDVIKVRENIILINTSIEEINTNLTDLNYIFNIKYSDFNSKKDNFDLSVSYVVPKINKFNQDYILFSEKNENFLLLLNEFNNDKTLIDEKLSVFDIDYLISVTQEIEQARLEIIQLKKDIESFNIGNFQDFESSFGISNA